MKIANVETAKGTIHLTLFDKDAPKTVENFVEARQEGLLRRHHLPPRDHRTS